MEKKMGLKELLKSLELPQDITRRGFLKATSMAAVLTMVNEARAKQGVRPYIVLETAKGVLIADPNLCVACHGCELACTEFNEGKASPRLARIKVTRNVFFGPEGTQSLPMTQGVWGNGVVVQETCRQCAHPVPCANACPQGAIRVDPKTGARKVDTKLCIGCHLCEKACPWGMMSFDVEEKKASKCFLCDGDPNWVKACRASAIRYIPWIDRTEDRPRHTTHGYYAQENNAQCSICHR